MLLLLMYREQMSIYDSFLFYMPCFYIVLFYIVLSLS